MEERSEMTDLEVSACLMRVRQRDESAARDLIHYMYPMVYKIVRSHLPRKTSEEDLLQTVYIKVMQNLDSFSGQVPFLHWVSRIAVNTCLNEIRREKHRPEYRYADLSEDEQAVIEQLATTDEELSNTVGARELVDQLLAKLDPEDRFLMNLLYLQGQSIKEIQELTGWSMSMIKVRAFRARGQMRRFLRHTDESPPMNPDSQLNRLFQAAARQQEPRPPLSYRLERSALSAWQEGPVQAQARSWEDSYFWLRAVACATLVTLFCLILPLTQKTDPLAESIRLADQNLPWETNQ